MESACPELDAATRELATTLAARRARAIARRARARATRTPAATTSNASGIPPRVASPLRLASRRRRRRRCLFWILPERRARPQDAAIDDGVDRARGRAAWDPLHRRPEARRRPEAARQRAAERRGSHPRRPPARADGTPDVSPCTRDPDPVAAHPTSSSPPPPDDDAARGDRSEPSGGTERARDASRRPGAATRARATPTRAAPRGRLRRRHRRAPPRPTSSASSAVGPAAREAQRTRWLERPRRRRTRCRPARPPRTRGRPRFDDAVERAAMSCGEGRCRAPSPPRARTPRRAQAAAVAALTARFREPNGGPEDRFRRPGRTRCVDARIE